MAECIHLMDPAEACGTCNPLLAAAVIIPELLGPWFIASYAGQCAGCGDDIAPDDEIRADGLGHYLGRCCGGEDG